ncbi:MAG TPA: MarC family protein, partial [Chlamydiales bacterium]|nr:MarC family protein [Chlamydiales bacterium]
LIIDPIGSVRSFLKYTQELKPKRQRQIIFREMLLALVLMVAFNFLGEHLFKLFGISDTTVFVASGVILFIIALQILFPRADQEVPSDPLAKEPFLVPLAIPIIAGPASLATIMLFADLESDVWMTLGAICIAWAASCFILLFSKTLFRYLGSSGLLAAEKLMGIVLMLLAVQRILAGITIFHTHAWPTH